MPKVPKNVKKAFALSACIGACLRSSKNGDPKLTALGVQIDRAMRVFNAKAGRKLYWSISNGVNVIWDKLANKHNTSLTDDEISVFVEYMCMLIPPKEFKDFLGVNPYQSIHSIRPDRVTAVSKSVLDLDEELNNLFGTKPYTMVKPKKKVEKQKKERQRSNKIENRRNRAKKREQVRSEKVRASLRDMVARAKEKQGATQ